MADPRQEGVLADFRICEGQNSYIFTLGEEGSHGKNVESGEKRKIDFRLNEGKK